MTVTDGQAPRRLERSEPACPWIAAGSASGDLPTWICNRPGWRIASSSLPVDHLSGAELEDAARRVFSSVLRDLGAPPARVWAYLPRITSPDTDGLDRYMRMNQGRGRAYRDSRLPFTPAGTCTGHAGGDLVVHAVATDTQVRPVENPRQRPAWSYSARFGPAAPPFTRGVIGRDELIASGTASVVGEDSLHPGDALAQWDETMCNLQVLSASAGATGHWRAVRVYVSGIEHFEAISRKALAAFGASVDSILLAPLCRRELLVEVEGIRDVRDPIV